jgi:hypothetical protein
MIKVIFINYFVSSITKVLVMQIYFYLLYKILYIRSLILGNFFIALTINSNYLIKLFSNIFRYYYDNKSMFF